jgi:hypothetical protein
VYEETEGLSVAPLASEEGPGPSIAVPRVCGPGKRGELSLTVPVLSYEERKDYGTYMPGEIELLQVHLESMMYTYNTGTPPDTPVSVSGGNSGARSPLFEMEGVDDGEYLAYEPENTYLIPPNVVLVGHDEEGFDVWRQLGFREMEELSIVLIIKKVGQILGSLTFLFL